MRCCAFRGPAAANMLKVLLPGREAGCPASMLKLQLNTVLLMLLLSVASLAGAQQLNTTNLSPCLVAQATRPDRFRPVVRGWRNSRWKTVLALDGGDVRVTIQTAVLCEVELAVKRALLFNGRVDFMDIDDFDILLADWFDFTAGRLMCKHVWADSHIQTFTGWPSPRHACIRRAGGRMLCFGFAVWRQSCACTLLYIPMCGAGSSAGTYIATYIETEGADAHMAIPSLTARPGSALGAYQFMQSFRYLVRDSQLNLPSDTRGDFDTFAPYLRPVSNRSACMDCMGMSLETRNLVDTLSIPIMWLQCAMLRRSVLFNLMPRRLDNVW
mmetsp:Transcript_38373/g.113798  ORF Transcript_38373/g.113798 Transcript_38373/m.113798 type:complete len:327 (-) Transcript_38373:3431-4411(-)